MTLTGRLRPFPRLGAGVAIAAILCLSFAVWQIGRRSVAGETERVKGQHPYLTIYRKTAQGFERLRDRSAAAPGDRIQIGYVAAGKPYGMIFSIDGNGVLTVHFPVEDASGDGATKLETNGEHLLPESFELDEAPRYERFYFITSDHPVAVARVVSEYGRGGEGRMPGRSAEASANTMTTFTLLKGGLK
jgi:hypothetical protein